MQRYEKYKDSGVDWLGEIPEHWEVKPGFTVLKERKDKNTGMKSNNVLSLSYGKIIEKPVGKLTGLVPENFETYQLVSPGDIIFRPTDLQNDKVSLRTGLSMFKGIITSAYINLQPVNAHSKFLHYFLHTTDTNKVIYGLGSGLRQNISYLDFKRFLMGIPPIHEQESIVKFLDNKCKKIDTTVNLKEQQIEKLNELREITIHNAVTRGIPHSNGQVVKMKDSGIDWIGEIPEHWEVKRLKRVLKAQGRIGFKGYSTSDLVSAEEGALVLGASHMDWNGNLKLNDPVYLSWHKYYESPEIMVNKGDIVIVQRGSTCGKVSLIVNDLGNVTINPSLVLLKNISINNFFCFLAIKCSLQYILGLMSKTAIPMISQEQINNISIPIPRLAEQEEIVAYLEEQTSKIDKAISQRREQIVKLKEYKQSLINEVVTGKVRVN